MPGIRKTITFSIWLPTEFDTWLSNQARLELVSKADIIRRALLVERRRIEADPLIKKMRPQTLEDEDPI